MKPLSALFYSLHNRKKLLSMVISIGLSIMLIYVIQFFVYEIKHSNYYTDLNPLSEFSEVSKASEMPISEEIINRIISQESTEKVIPLIRQHTFYYPAAGKNVVSVFSLNSEDMTYLMNKLKLTLVTGRLPENNKKEAVMDYRVAKNKKVKIGDKIGYEVNKKELYIKETYEIVGFIDGESMLVLTSRTDQMDDKELYSEGMLVFHKEGALDLSNTFLNSLPKGMVSLRTYQIAFDAQKKDMEDIKRYINILVVMLIVVLSISMGNASYIHTFHRRYEYALLYSVGYSPMWILFKAIKEVFFTSAIGYAIGMVTTILFAGITYLVLFEPNGLVLKLFLPEAFLQTLVIPMFVSLFCIIPINRMLRKIDPIRIIEGVD